ncbi:MAG: hypothetical protein ACRDP5_12575 [Streptosporangiaceae bacterium]
MDARTRVRQFLARGTADRPPFLVMATRYTARLAQCDPADLLADPGLFVRSYTESVAVLGLDAILIEVPPALASALIEVPPALASAGGPAASARAVLRENLHRLRATLRDQIAIVTLLPGPLTLAASLGVPATPDSLDDLVTALIGLQEYLGPVEFDALALLERAAVADPEVPALADAASAFWNVARYYSLPSLLIAAQATPRLAAVGATAVAAWSGAAAADLLAAGATAAGQPPPSAPVPPPPGAFYLTPDELSPDQPVDAVRFLLRQLPRA